MAQINIFPAAAQAGGCSATYESYYTGTGDIGFGPQGSQYQYTNYQLIATAADGWAVDRVVYHRSWTASDGTSGTDTTTTRNISTNPFLQPENKVYTTYEYPGDFQKISGGDWPVHTTSRTITAVDVYFKTGPTPPPGVHNVSATSNPSQGGEVQVGSGERGTHSVDAVAVGGSVTLTAYPTQGWALDGWYENSTKLSDSTTLTLSNVTTDRTLVARFKEVCHIVVTAFKSQCSVSLNGVPGDETSSAWTVVEADIDKNSTFTISATPLRPSIKPFKTWYLNPTAPGNPESGTPISNEPTITLTATDSATYFATVRRSYTITVRAEDTWHDAAPSAVVSINSQTSGGNTYTLEVPEASTVVVEATDYGGEGEDYWGLNRRLYFKEWRNAYDETTVSTALQYSFTASDTYLIAVYESYFKLLTAIVPDDSYGSIEADPQSTHDWYYSYSTESIILTAKPKGTRFVKWTKVRDGIETQISTNPTITVSGSLDHYYWRECTYKAYFDKTHLLVNSSDLSTPVQLVYDPATNLLVADY